MSKAKGVKSGYWGIVLALCLQSAAEAVVPPKAPGLTLPRVVLENLRRDPGFYMPERAFVGQMRRYHEAKLSLAKSGVTPAPVQILVPVVAMQYADVEAEWPISDMENQLFDTHSPWPTGSMRAYYKEVSYGALDLSGDVIGWIPVSGTKEYYYRDPDGFSGDNTYELFTEALGLSDDAVDYGRYDNDGPDGIPNSGDDDGYVDQVVFIHSGTGGEYGGPEIWSHSWSLQGLGSGPYTTNDARPYDDGFIQVDEYVVQPAIGRGEMERIGVFCHEFGHALGLPDLYDRDGSSEGIGNWGLMGSGGSVSSRPSHMSAWSKEVLGWITPIVLTGNLYDQLIPAVTDTPVVYKLWGHGDIEPYAYTRHGLSVSLGREYFLVENRYKQKFDDELPESGLLVWHIQNDVKSQNDDENNKLVDLEAADDGGGLDRGRNRGDAGDPYPGSTDNRAFRRATFPSSATQAGGYSKVAIDNISDPGDTMYADLSAVARDLVYQGHFADDSDGGNQDGYADPGEMVGLSLSLLNLGQDIPEITFTLYSNDSQITITDDRAVYTNIPEDSLTTSADDTFEFTVAPEAEYHPLVFSAVGRAGDHTERYSIIVMMENLFILLVDDSMGEVDPSGGPIITYYQSALDRGGIPYYSNWSNLAKGIPPSTVLDSFRTVIWLTGSSQQTLDAAEQGALASYLNGGGTLLLAGQNIGLDLDSLGTSADSLFYANVLKAAFVADDPGVGSNIMLTGVPDDPISGNYTRYFFLSGGNSANNQSSPDLMVPINGATTTMNFYATGLYYYSAGIKYQGDDYRLVYYSFGLEGINESNNAIITRAALMRRSIGWLQEDERLLLAITESPPGNHPQAFNLLQNYPNPFNAVTTISYVIAGSGEVELTIYDILGREVSRASQRHSGGGRYAFIWRGRNAFGAPLPSGVYLYRVQFHGQALVHKLMLLK